MILSVLCGVVCRDTPLGQAFGKQRHMGADAGVWCGFFQITQDGHFVQNCEGEVKNDI